VIQHADSISDKFSPLLKLDPIASAQVAMRMEDVNGYHCHEWMVGLAKTNWSPC